MASSDARPIPRKNVAYRVTFPIFDADGDLVTGATGLDSEVSKDGGAFADCTSEATEIATASGMYYLDLTSTEMDADTVAVIVKTTSSGAKTTPIVMYPEEAGDVRVDVVQISGDSTAADNAESFFDGTGYAGTNNVIPTVTTVNGLANNVITAASIATGAIDADAIAADAIGASELAADAIAEIADAVWDEVTSGHVTAGTFGQRNSIVRANTAAAGAGNSITLDASASSVDDFYNNTLIVITGGTGAGQSRFITDYVGSTQVATVGSNWATNPDNTSVFIIIPFASIPGASAPTAAEVADAVWDEATAGHTTSGTFGEQLKTDVDAILADTGTDGVVVASINAGAITASAIADNAIDAGAIASDAITAAKIASGAITSAKFAAGAITATVIATDAIDADALAADAVTEIQSGLSTLTAAQVNTEVDTALADINLDHLVKIAVDTDFPTTVHLNSVMGYLADNGTTATFDRTTDSLEALYNKAVDVETDTQDIQGRLPAALVSGRMDSNMQAAANGVITAAVIATDAIDADAIADNAINAASIAADAITSAKIADGAITAAKIADGAIDAATFASGAITADAIAADAIGSSELAASAVTEIQSGLSTLTAAQVNAEVDTALADVGLTTTITGRIDAAVSTRATPAQVNAEVLDVLTVDTFAEPSAVPAATSTLKDKLNWLFALARNKRTTTSSLDTLRNDADNGSIATATLSDDNTTFTRAEYS